MKKSVILTCIFSLIFFASCSDEKPETEHNDNETNEAAAGTNDESDTADNEEAADSKGENTNDGAVSTAVNAKSILKDATEAMAELTSFKGTSDYIDETTMNGESTHTEGTFTMKIVYGDPKKLYVQSSDVSSEVGEGEFEIYMTGDHYYVNSEGHWFSIPVDSEHAGMYEQFKFVEGDQFEQFSDFSDNFDVTDNGDHYLLTFTGDDAAYGDLIFGSAVSVSSGMLEEHLENMEVSDGHYEITVDKKTGYVTGYRMEYSSATSSDLGDVEQYYEGTFSLSDFNEIEDITVPEDVIENAEPLQ